MRHRFILLVLSATVLAACGGGGSPMGPSATPTPSPTPPVGTNSLSAVVFYDENGNGVLDAAETVRLPNVTVTAGGRTGVSAPGGGRAVVSSLPAGTQTVSIQADTLPPYYRAGAAVSASLPQAPGTEVALAATLPIGNNRRNRYMAFGDSISAGEGSSDGSGYRSQLLAQLRAYWGQADVVDEGASGTHSDRGEQRMSTALSTVRPAYTLILYGTNDWNSLECRDEFPCYTIDALRSMVRQCRDARSLPVVGTIPPVNPNFVDRDATERNQWVTRMNDLIRPMVQQEGAVLADIQAVFLKEANLAGLFADRIHPNDRGYLIMSREWMRALTSPTATTAPSALPDVFLAPGS